MELTPDQKRAMLEDGFVHFPGLLPAALVDNALRAINHSVGEGMDPADMTRFRVQSFCPEVKNTPPIADLFYQSPARSLAEAFLGPDKIRPVKGGQIALRFPRKEARDEAPLPDLRPHVDGMPTPTNGVPAGVIGNFTALLACFLSDVPEPWSGNFVVWPGTHRQHAAYFRAHSPQDLLNGMPKVERPPPQQITARKGDVVLAHYLLGHGVATNCAANPRYAVFFRLSSTDHVAPAWESMADEWLHWPGMRGVV